MQQQQQQLMELNKKRKNSKVLQSDLGSAGV